MNNLYQALEICLQNMEEGADLETIFVHYPNLADELRPILATAIAAKGLSSPPPSTEIVRRNRAKVLQRAAEMRVAKAKSKSQRFWSGSLRRAAVALAVTATLFASGTGLVRAASTTLPGDHLYSVKRTWEDVLVLFTFNLQQREALEIEHENERLDELNELFVAGRVSQVEFSGLVTHQNGTEWLVSRIPVAIYAQTILPDQPVAIGDAVNVMGQTQSDDTVLATRIELLPSSARLPKEVENNQTEIEVENPEQQPTPQIEDHSNNGSETESPEIEETNHPKTNLESEPKNQSSDNDDEKDSSDDSASDD